MPPWPGDAIAREAEGEEKEEEMDTVEATVGKALPESMSKSHVGPMWADWPERTWHARLIVLAPRIETAIVGRER